MTAAALGVLVEQWVWRCQLVVLSGGALGRVPPALRPTLNALPAVQKFRWDLYVRNREYQALLGFVAGVVFLAAKMVVALGSAHS